MNDANNNNMIDPGEVVSAGSVTINELKSPLKCIDANHDGKFNGNEAIISDSGNNLLDVGTLDGTGTDKVVSSGEADLTLFNRAEKFVDGNSNGSFDVGEAIIYDWYDSATFAGEFVLAGNHVDKNNRARLGVVHPPGDSPSQGTAREFRRQVERFLFAGAVYGHRGGALGAADGGKEIVVVADVPAGEARDAIAQAEAGALGRRAGSHQRHPHAPGGRRIIHPADAQPIRRFADLGEDGFLGLGRFLPAGGTETGHGRGPFRHVVHHGEQQPRHARHARAVDQFCPIAGLMVVLMHAGVRHDHRNVVIEQRIVVGVGFQAPGELHRKPRAVVLAA